MFFPEGQVRVHLCGQPCDMRKSYDGLQALARHAMGHDPLDGGRVLFVQKVAVCLLRCASDRPKLLIRRAAQRSARLEIGTCRGS